MIHLAVGRLEIDWGKNQGFRDHSALFQGERGVTDVLTTTRERRMGRILRVRQNGSRWSSIKKACRNPSPW
ncbi:hypothetical protein [Pseudaminobacter sp. NGMCC 1.201702]|uniref:hypothetical protein n=1 Tax=Pseudaminobacter sp. NGMCC 1.201702 TaxID=3391825 RepID=UPI0039EE701C